MLEFFHNKEWKYSQVKRFRLGFQNDLVFRLFNDCAFKFLDSSSIWKTCRYGNVICPIIRIVSFLVSVKTVSFNSTVEAITMDGNADADRERGQWVAIVIFYLSSILIGSYNEVLRYNLPDISKHVNSSLLSVVFLSPIKFQRHWAI